MGGTTLCRSEVIQEVLQRLRTGQKATGIARQDGHGLSVWQIRKIAHEHRIVLRRGPPTMQSTAARQERFDRRHGPGAAVKLLQRVRTLGVRRAGKGFGKSWEWAHKYYYHLGGTRPELIQAMRQRQRPQPKLGRPDITLDVIRKLAKRCRSITEIARRLGCSASTISNRARNKVQLPKGRTERRDLTRGRFAWAARWCRSQEAICRMLKVYPSLLHRKSRAYRIALPDGRKERSHRRHAA